MKTSKSMFYFSLFIAVAGMLFLSACKDKTTEPDTTPTATRDAAEAISSNVAYQTGGTVDQIADLCSFVTANGLDNIKSRYPDTFFTIEKTYNDTTGVWTIHIERERGDEGSVPYAFIMRDYTLQFINANGDFQRRYITAADTARTVHFNVLDGYGRHITHRLSQQLNLLTAHWTVTNANQAYVTINGDYSRSAVDTLTIYRRTRISNHTLVLNVQDVVAPRGEHADFANAISGNVTGHFHADVTFIHGTAYSEHVIDRDIDITFGGGKGNIDINGTTYKANLNTGELID